MNATCLSALFFAALAAGSAAAAGPARCPKLEVVGLTSDQRLVSFRACKPGRVREIGPVTGLGGGDAALVGIDFRVQGGLLYGVGDGGGVYTLDAATGAASFVSQLSVALEGASFGVDFNPAANRLRIVSDTGQNLRHDVGLATGGTTADAPLSATGVAAAAYTNNDLTAMSPPNTATTLFDLNPASDELVIQSPPNDGSLAATGQLGVDAGAAAGFDVYTVPGADGRAEDNVGLAVLSVSGVPGLYRIELLTGEASLLGPLGDTVVDLAIPLSQ
jgi:hypothetical protein